MQHRQERVGELLLSFLSTEIRRASDPVLELVMFNYVSLSPDLKSAKIYWSTLTRNVVNKETKEVTSLEATPTEIAEISAHLEAKNYYLKKKIGAELKLRFTPKLIFKYDDSVARGMNIDRLLSGE
jgi:ribosome-binding factor A